MCRAASAGAGSYPPAAARTAESMTRSDSEGTYCELPRIDSWLGHHEPGGCDSVGGLDADAGRRSQLAGEDAGGGADAALVEDQHGEAQAQVDALGNAFEVAVQRARALQDDDARMRPGSGRDAERPGQHGS